MEFFTSLLATNPAVISFGTVALALGTLISIAGGLAYKAVQPPQSSGATY
jgi:hypothetical protein